MGPEWLRATGRTWAGPAPAGLWEEAGEKEAWRTLPEKMLAGAAGEKHRVEQRRLLNALQQFLDENPEQERSTAKDETLLRFFVWLRARSPRVTRVSAMIHWRRSLGSVLQGEWRMSKAQIRKLDRALSVLQTVRAPPQLREVQPQARRVEEETMSLNDVAWGAVRLVTRAGARRADAARWAVGWAETRRVSGDGVHAVEVRLTVEKADMQGARPVPEPMVLSLTTAAEVTRFLGAAHLAAPVEGTRRQREAAAEAAFVQWCGWISSLMRRHGIADVRALRRDVGSHVMEAQDGSKISVAAQLRQDPKSRTPTTYAGAVRPQRELAEMARRQARPARAAAGPSAGISVGPPGVVEPARKSPAVPAVRAATDPMLHLRSGDAASASILRLFRA